MSDDREFLRHTLATLAYRAAKAMRNAPAEFPGFKASPTSRTPIEILAHMGDLMDWGLAMTRGKPAFKVSDPLPWDQETQRFFAALTAWDEYLASGAEIGYDVERLFQGPIADALTHVGQINLLRRASGSPVKGESYNRASIAAGQTAFEQPPPDPKYEFD
jgi:hypothetical protein